MNFKDKVVLITGASRGIGAATALEFGKQGAKVIVNYKKSEKKAHEIAKQIGKDSSIVVQADVSTPKGVNKLVKATIEEFQHIDILINNAGAIIRPGDWKTDEETWDNTMDVNLKGVWMMIKQSTPYIPEGGSIVNLTSTYGITGAAPVLPYTVAKGGVITLTKAMAKELAPKIRVNAVAPSNVMTDMTKGAGDELIEFFRQKTPLKRLASPSELAKPILFLASEDASYITGETLIVDGGYTLT